MSEYVNNKQFYAMICKFKEECNKAEDENLPTPRIPEPIGNCFVMIATKLATKGNFVGYTYKDEMISDALENCVVAVHSFNPEKSKNPFAYFTQIIWYAFLRRIEKEKKQTYVKYKALEHLALEERLNDVEGELYSKYDTENEKMKPIIEKFDKKKTSKKKKDGGLEKFL
jgi:hypothetical protein